MSDKILSSLSPVQSRTSFLVMLICALLIAVLYLPALGELQLTREEPRRALIAQTMLDSGDYWVPELIEKTYTAKPPLYNQFIALLSMPNDSVVTEFSARLTSVISVIFLLILMIFLTRGFLGISGLVFLSLGLVFAPEIIIKGRLAEIDMLFTLLVAASLWVWFYLHTRETPSFGLWLPPMLILVLAFLTKREPALLFFYSALIPYLIWQKQFRSLLGPAHLISLAIMTGLICLAYMPVINRLGWEPFWANTIHEANDLQGKFQLIAYLKNLLIYPLKVFGALFPYSLLLFTLLIKPIRTAVLNHDNRPLMFAALVVLISLPLYSIPEEPKVRYFLPLFPNILIVCAICFEAFVNRLQSSHTAGERRFELGVRLLLLMLTLTVSIALLYKLHAPDFPAYFSWPVQLVCLLLIAMLAVTSQRRAWLVSQRMLGTILSMSLAVFAFRQFYQLPRELDYQAMERDTDSVEIFLKQNVPELQRPVLLTGELPYDLFFYIDSDLITPTGCGDSHCNYLLGYEEKLQIAGIDLDDWEATGETVHFKREPLRLYRRRD